MSELNKEFEHIRDWAEERGIYEKGDVKTQALKLVEEAGELAKAILNDDELEFCDALGDCNVVLVSIAKLGSIHFNNPDITLENCINGAYDVISKRKGSMSNGTFKKQE